ncbi:MAG: MFS transporter, partial [Massilia sp.]
LRGSLNSRVTLLFILMIGEGVGLLWLAKADSAAYAIAAILVFGLFTHMACGATYALVPFIDRNALGGVAGIIGAGGNVGAVAAGFLMKGTGSIQQTLTILSGAVVLAALCAIAARFKTDTVTSSHAATVSA